MRVYGNSAVAITHAVTTGTFYGKPQSVEDRIIFVAVKDGDAWRFVNAQMTPIAGEPTSGNSKTMSGSNRAIRPRVELLLVAGLEVGEHCLDLIDFVERDVMSPTATDL